MYSPVSTQFLASCRQSSRVATVCDLYVAGTLVKSNVPVVSGSITADATADIRRSASLTLINPNATQDASQGLVSGRATADLRDFFLGIDIYQTEIAIKTGFIYSFGNVELVPVGRYMIWSASIDFDQGDVISLELFDRAKYLEQAGIVQLYDFSGQSAQAAIQTLVNAALPVDQTVLFGAGIADVILPGGTTYDTTHLDAVLDLADLLGGAFYFDPTGQARVDAKTEIDSTTTLSQAVFSCATGEPDGNITAISRSLSRDEIFNGVGVYGSQPSDALPQVYGEAYDLDPASRTYWQGAFGKSFKRIDRPELTNNADCLKAAQAELGRSVSGAVPTQMEVLINPALYVGDLISVYFPFGDPEIHLVDSIDYDIEQAHMSITTRGKTTGG